MRMVVHKISSYDSKYILNQLQEMDQEIKFRTNHKLNPARMAQNGNSWLVIVLQQPRITKFKITEVLIHKIFKCNLGAPKLFPKLFPKLNSTEMPLFHKICCNSTLMMVRTMMSHFQELLLPVFFFENKSQTPF